MKLVEEKYVKLRPKKKRHKKILAVGTSWRPCMNNNIIPNSRTPSLEKATV